MRVRTILFFVTLTGAAGCAATTTTQAPSGAARYDVIIRRGVVYDGTGAAGVRADVAIRGDRIATIGDLSGAAAALEINADGLAVAPGFINMLSWATESLIADGRSVGEIRQGVTTEVFGEGTSLGPLTDEMKRRWKSEQGNIKFETEWTTLAEYLKYLEKKGVAPNVASFIGAGTIREHVIGHDNRKPTPAELDRMRALVRQEMEAGALGIGSSLIYAPDNFASTEELIELCEGRRGARRPLYLAHAQRGQPSRRSRAGADPHQPGSEDPGRDLPPQGRRTGQLGKDGPRPRARRRGARIRASDHRGHVPVSGRVHRPERGDSAVSARGWIPGAVQAAPYSSRTGADPERDGDAHRRVGKPAPGRRIGRARAARGLQVGEAQAAHGQDARRGRKRVAARIRSTRSSTSCSRTNRASAPSTF